MKKIIKLTESDLQRIINRVMLEDITTHAENVEYANYMFFSNLEKMKKQCEELLAMDKQMVDELLNNGHDWADDHITQAAESVDQVYEFLKSEEDKSKEYIEFEDMPESVTEGRKKTGTKLCARGKAAAKAKFKVHPSAYSNGYGVQVCKGTKPGLDGKKRCSPPYC
jgi:hypothetical protein